MIKLVDILQEVVADNNLKNEFEDLADAIEGNIKDAAQETNEAILTIAATALAVPKIVNSISKVVGIIAKKSGIDLKKRDNPAWYKVIEKVSDNIDQYLDRPFQIVLTPFIQDKNKRNKVAGVLKAATLITMALSGGVDLASIKNTISNLAGEFGTELTVNKLPDLTVKLKSVIQSILK